MGRINKQKLKRVLWPASRPAGFTIIEVLIVLAVVGLILLVVFLAVPTVQKSSRDYQRKQYASLIAAQMDEYYANNSNYPAGSQGYSAFNTAATQTEICNFLKGLPQVSSTATCGTDNDYDLNGVQAHCTTVQANAYTVCYQNFGAVDHNYVGPYDQINVMLAHWCNPYHSTNPTDQDDPVTYPVYGEGGDTNTKRYVVWTPLERSDKAFCIDNFPTDYDGG